MRWVIFELDGTLSRTDRFMVPAIQEAMRQCCIPVRSEEEIRSTIGIVSIGCLYECGTKEELNSADYLAETTSNIVDILSKIRN